MEKTDKMDPSREAAILQAAVDKWGSQHQVAVAIGTLSDLQKTLCKYLRLRATHDLRATYEVSPDIREAIADVNIMLGQMQLIFGSADVERVAKLESLERLLPLAPQQTLAHRDASGKSVLNDLPPNSQQKYRAIEIMHAIDLLYPAAKFIRRAMDGHIEFVRLRDRLPFLEESYLQVVDVDGDLFPYLPLGGIVGLGEILQQDVVDAPRLCGEVDADG